jgi:hypothetical protein
MNDNNLSTQIVSYVALAIAIGGMIVGVFNHRRITSTCCRHTATMSLDIDNTTPRGAKVERIEPVKESSPTLS